MGIWFYFAILSKSMVTNCDICGFPIVGQQNYCNGCGVDLQESKENKFRDIPTLKNTVRSPPRKENGNENNIPKIKWCWLKWGELPHVLAMIALLAQGRSKLGFCECAACNQGYREWLAFTTNLDGKENLKASSREIVKKAREEDFTEVTLNVAHLVNNLGLKGRDVTDQVTTAPTPPINRTSDGKILIELDESVIERAVLNVFSSEQGQNIIKNAYSPKRKRSKD